MAVSVNIARRLRFAIGARIHDRALCRAVKRLCGLVAVGLACAAAAEAQELVIRGGPSCDACEIRLRQHLTLGGPDGPGDDLIAVNSSVAIDSQGQILVSSGAVGRGEFAVFDSTGSFIRTVGRAGEGPGEFMLIQHLNAGPASIQVFDPLLQRRTMLDVAFNLIRTDRVRGQVGSSVVFEDDQVAFFADLASPRSVGMPIHVLSIDGDLTSFGYDGSVYRGNLRSQSIAARPPAFGRSGTPGIA